MTTIPSEAIGAAPTQWLVRRTADGDELVSGEQLAAERQAENSGLGFLDLLDVVNPLQHLPVVGTIYRALTGDTMSDAARMAGGALYGGPLGLIGALANVVVEAETGQDIGGNAMAWLGNGAEAGADTALAGTQPATAAEPVNAAPVTIAAALASPAALAAAVPQAGDAGGAQSGSLQTGGLAAGAGAVQSARNLSPEARPGKSDFRGRSADRLDAFIQQASAVRRNNPLAGGRGPASPAASALAAANPASPALGIPGAIDPVRLQAAALKPPASAAAAKSADGSTDSADRGPTLAGADTGSVNQWMLRALDKYEHMRKQETS